MNGQTTTQSPAAAWLIENARAAHDLAHHFSSDALRRRLDVMERRPRYTGPAIFGGAYLGERGELVIDGRWKPEHVPLLIGWIETVFTEATDA